MGAPDFVEIFGSFMPWKLDEKTWILQFMNGSIISLKEVLENFDDNVQRMWALRDAYDFVLPNHNGTPIAKCYVEQYAELFDAIKAGKITIEDKLNHKYIEMDPVAPELCRVRYKGISIFARKKELLEVMQEEA